MVKSVLAGQKTPVLKGLSFVYNSAKSSAQKINLKNFTAKQLLAVFILPALMIVAAIYFAVGNKPPQSAVKAPEVSGIPGWWLEKHFGASTCDREVCFAATDGDKDGLTNEQEFYYHSDPLNAHTVKDSLNDGELVAAGYDPSRGGRVSFDEAVSDESVLGESILYDQDIKDMVQESQDINKIAIPEVAQEELNVLYVDTPEAYKDYLVNINNLSTKYFPHDNLSTLTQVLGTSGDNPGVVEIIKNARLMSADLKNVKVPAKFVSFHKYNISFFQLLADVLTDPPAQDLVGAINPQADLWYDKAQAFLAVQQKLSFERQLLNREFSQ